MEIIIYQNENGKNKVAVTLEDNNLWLSQIQMAELFDTTKQNISLHIKNIFEEGELAEQSTVKEYLTVQNEGSRNVSRAIKHYNLELIIAVGYRVRSKQGTQFRIWATEILKEYISKGFAMNDELLKNAGGGNYWKELLNRIRDIRSSEKVFYRQVLDLYATSIDYEPSAEESITFFKIVQNKLHYATHGNTAAEIIFNRIDSSKEFLGLFSFKGDLPTKAEAQIAKNYLDEKELKTLNNLVSGYFDFAEVYAQKHEHLYMKDYIDHLDKILHANGDEVLLHSGTISHKKAMEKVEEEYSKFQQKTLTAVEKSYLETIKAIEEKVNKKFQK